MHPYRCSALMQQFGADGTGRRHPWVFPVLKKLGSLARAMAYLVSKGFDFDLQGVYLFV